MVEADERRLSRLAEEEKEKMGATEAQAEPQAKRARQDEDNKFWLLAQPSELRDLPAEEPGAIERVKLAYEPAASMRARTCLLCEI